MSVTSSLRPELQLKIDAQGINGRKYLQSNQEEIKDVHHRVNGERQTNSLVHSSHEFEHNKEQRASSITVPNTCVQSSKGDNNFIDVNHERKVINKTDEYANNTIHSSYHHHEEQQQHQHYERQQEESKLTITNDKSNNIVNNTMTTNNNNIATVAKSKELVQEPSIPGTVEAQIMNNVEISLNTSKAKLVIPTLQIPHVLASSSSTSVSKSKNVNTNFAENAYQNKQNYANVDSKASNEAITATTSTNTTESLHKELSDEVRSLRKSAIRHLRCLFSPLVMRRVLRARRYRKYEAFALEHFYTVHDVSYILSIYSSLSSSRAAHLEDTNATTDATTSTTGLYHLTPLSLLTSSHITRTQRHLPQALSESFLSECPRDFCESLACMAVFTPVRRSW